MTNCSMCGSRASGKSRCGELFCHECGQDHDDPMLMECNRCNEAEFQSELGEQTFPDLEPTSYFTAVEL
jgi:hypothetical protein